jgi:hypothetical protein
VSSNPAQQKQPAQSLQDIFVCQPLHLATYHPTVPLPPPEDPHFIPQGHHQKTLFSVTQASVVGLLEAAKLAQT